MALLNGSTFPGGNILHRLWMISLITLIMLRRSVTLGDQTYILHPEAYKKAEKNLRLTLKNKPEAKRPLRLEDAWAHLTWAS